MHNMKKRILIIPVNYNSYDCLHTYLKSIETGYSQVVDLIDLVVHVADNSTSRETFKTDSYNLPSLSVTACGNLGYLGGVLEVLKRTEDKACFDYIIISNVDLTLSPDFFIELSKVISNKFTGWIAPMIYSSEEERDKNPKIRLRPSEKKMRLLKVMYKFPILHKLYTATLYKRKKNLEHQAGEIFAGHGSFIILTKNFIDANTVIEYPVFLFGEEIFLGELCRQANLKVIYNPDLKVFDREHVSTGGMERSFYYRCNYEAISYLLKAFYVK